MEPPSESPTFTTRPHPAGWELSLVLVLSKQKGSIPPFVTGICHWVFDKRGGWFAAMLACGIPLRRHRECFWKVLKQTSGGGDETWDAFNLRGFIRKAAQWWWFQQLASAAAPKAVPPIRLGLNVSPSSSTSAFPLPSRQTQVGRWQHANPALAGPLQCQFPPWGYMPLLIPSPHPQLEGSGWNLLRNDNITNLGDEMRVTS